ncbi:hypothetical protein MGG_14932 [Pyricularia oryzae 70-15]|uniref:Uncharacterized protein n=4 Tax=Pyricularia oryzae TaxID=318829 RepID=G4NH94_PYRO7|nr:uncharacterized protein MGG_14932 [Pyricularia oryzae 70-15]ELQ39730.1 hypothetical protein OOU_Y34scaffold00487g75 [Pyricularia oryzae Y34]KAI7916667.1 hypothetical protein M9X92_007781 [Pyricularia oryzae]EHA47604.1 hypothetical protein MGG_14932 [Pyricularia oryzae 70-15]KAI7931928.1 hypothetical protein M0657_000942 [Pyricularia oryzae]QBZ64855.1 hypothetical protein PoMZ_06556 [Pyricularia oryzae]
MVRLQVENKLRQQRGSCKIFGVSFVQGSIMRGIMVWRENPDDLMLKRLDDTKVWIIRDAPRTMA